MSSYTAHLKRIFQNIVLLYRNFFHWNVSKICVLIYENVLGLVVSLPFL